MILTLDIGNTTIGVCGLEQAEEDCWVLFSRKFPTPQDDSSLLPSLRALLEQTGTEPRHIEGAVLSSVVPRLEGPLAQAAERLLGKTPLLVGSHCKTGLTFAIPHPEQLGRDRVADAAWTARRYPLPAVTVDLGTATTFNVVDTGGVFLGGLILPGLETGVLALSSRTAQLPAVDLTGPERLIGRDTEECLRSGAVYGTAAMIDGITGRVEAELGRKTALILTGGWARLAASLCLREHVYDPWLLPKGLALLYDLNEDREQEQQRAEKSEAE